MKTRGCRKMKKLQFYTTVFGLVGGISLTGNIYFLKKDRENDQRQSQLEYELKKNEYEMFKLKELEEINSVSDLSDYFSGKLNFYWDSYAWMQNTFLSPQLVIQRPENAYGNLEITDAMYEKINYILSKYHFKSLRFRNLGSEFDISKLDILKTEFDPYGDPYLELEEVVTENCQKGFNYEILSVLWNADIKISHCEWSESLEKWLKQANLRNKSIEIYSDETAKYLNYLTEINQEIGTLIVISNANEEHLKLLSKIDAKKVVIDSRSYYQENLNFDLVLNENTEEIQLSFINYDGVVDDPNRLGNIKITSSNPNIKVSILSKPDMLSHANSITYITEDTKLDLPENSIVSVSRINYMYQGERCTLYGKIDYQKGEEIEEMIKPLVEETIQKKIGQK